MTIKKFDLNEMALKYITLGKERLFESSEEESYLKSTTTIQVTEDYDLYRIHQIVELISLHEDVSKCSVVRSGGATCLQIVYI